ncbi:MAG: F0F1 ATP synthase subunit epsilon [Coriobacteriia bacterium]|nr:F0F1 ATP synthase subunit epsilon [Coriobacteriia bacterium]
MTNKINCQIVTPDDKYFEGEAYMVVVPGIDGSLGFLPGHVPLVSPLGAGQLSISDTVNSNDGKKFNIEGGYVQFSDDNIIILAEHVEAV